METDKEQKLANTLYDKIKELLTLNDGITSHGLSLSDKSTLFQLSPAGNAILASDFDKAMSISNPTGNANQAEVFARIVDTIPTVSAIYGATTKSVDTVYGDVVKYGQSENPVVKGMLSDAKDVYDNSAHTGATGGTWHVDSPTPTTWYDPKTIAKSYHVYVSSDNIEIKKGSLFGELGGNTEFDLGWFKVATGAKGSITINQTHMESDSMSMEFDLMPVQILRPWMSGSVFNLNDWNLQGAFVAGQISNGKIVKDDLDHVMPMIPTVLAVVSNAEITGNWTTKDLETILLKATVDTSISIGPFKIGGTFSFSAEKSVFESSVDKQTITITGVQIVGWLNSVIPYTPPQ